MAVFYGYGPPEAMEVEEVMHDDREPLAEQRFVQQKDDDLPADWEKMPPGKSTIAVNLRSESEEYTSVLLHFLASFTAADVKVHRIFRIQNSFLFKHVLLKFQELMFENPGEEFKGQMLFHGTKASSVDSICRRGFDVRLSARTKFGEGCYFAMKSNYSHYYSLPTDGQEETPHILQSALYPREAHTQHPFNSTPTHRARSNLTPHTSPFFHRRSKPQPLFTNPSVASAQSDMPTLFPSPTSSSFSQRTPGQPVFSLLPISSVLSGPVDLSTTHTPQFPTIQISPLDLSNPAKPLDLSTTHPPSSASAATSQTAPKGARYMFVSWVLVGRQVRGHCTYRRPPPLHPGHPHGPSFDSCVDQEKDPNIVVIFDKHQAYPLFLVEYSCDSM